MTFSEAVAQLPAAIRLWVLWLTIAMAVTPLVLLALPGSRREGAVVLASSVIVVVGMQALHGAVGFVRLLGLPHVVVWTPLAVYLFRRLRAGAMGRPARIVAWIFLATITVSLIFDYVDVARWLAGDRAPMVPAPE